MDQENLLASGCLILCVLFNSIVLLCNFWSVDLNERFGFSTLKDDQIDDCTHVKVKMVNKKENKIKRTIVPIIPESVEFSANNVSKVFQIEF